jgi:hypothetical protein
MLFAQVDATMWLDIKCCGYGLVLLELSGWPDSTYDEMCAEVRKKSAK